MQATCYTTVYAFSLADLFLLSSCKELQNVCLKNADILMHLNSNALIVIKKIHSSFYCYFNVNVFDLMLNYAFKNIQFLKPHKLKCF